MHGNQGHLEKLRLTLGEAAAEDASRESPRSGVWCGVKAPGASSMDPLREAASALGLHTSSVGGDPTCERHSKLMGVSCNRAARV